ncbi:MAG: type II secretion system protein, partial [Eubacteriales bacterium]|nr:type II secretion system protein [Eubacteriales bacterium]
MHKWKHICRSQKQRQKQIQHKSLKSEAGFTLVELLAAISILGIVIVLAGSVHLFGQRQFRSQSK